MAGIYIHIPFCKQICHYCDFYKTGTSKLIEPFLESLTNEINLKKSFINEKVKTIYFGGGTPSVLNPVQIESILNILSESFDLNEVLEQTIEVNPDDLTLEYLKALKSLGFSRLSIGIQSFNDNILFFLNRRHNSVSAINSIFNAKNSGFDNISIDLIYGIPGQTLKIFNNDLDQLAALDISHLSAYHLGIEEKTYFGKMKSIGKLVEIPETLSESFYYNLLNWCKKFEFEQYEVSNFSRNKKYSLHNRNYWSFIPYLGFGPSAHSFYQNIRSYNVSNLSNYIKLINNGLPFFEIETLSEIDKKNEYIMLNLRTNGGINILEMNKMFSENEVMEFIRIVNQYIKTGHIRKQNNNYFFTGKGFFISDYIIRELMM